MGAIETFVSFCAVIIIFAIPFAVFAFVRYLRYKETIALAERGLLRPQQPRRNQDTLRWGIVITMVGMGLICGLWPLGFIVSSSDAVIEGPASGPTVAEEGDNVVGETVESPLPLGIGPWLVLGSVPFFFGLSLLIIYWLNKREGEGDEAISPHKYTGEEKHQAPDKEQER